MTEFIGLASAEDAEAILDLTLKAYQPISDLNIRFSAAHADIELVLHNITQNATCLLEKNGKITATITVPNLCMNWQKKENPLLARKVRIGEEA